MEKTKLVAKPKRTLLSLKNFVYDVWQKRVLNYRGSCALRCGRQTGKSTVIALKAYNLAHEYPGTNTLVLAPSLRQASLLYEKIRALFEEEEAENLAEVNRDHYRNITEYRNACRAKSIFISDPTQTRIRLKNGSMVICEPCGDTGAKIRGFTVDFLIADEAPFIPEAVWIAIIPMLATSNKMRRTGWTILLGTPTGKRGFFYEAFGDKGYLHIHVTSEKCSRIPKKFLTKQKHKLTKMQYAQEYLAEFVEAYDQFFPTEVINACATILRWDFSTEYNPKRSYYLGVDIARYGADSNAFVISELNGKNVKCVWCSQTNRKSTVETAGRIKALDDQWHFKRIFIDGVGVGGGVVDNLKEILGSKVKEMNNSFRKSGDDDREVKTGKEDWYSDALVLMENRKVEFLNHPSLISSLRSITFEYSADGHLKIRGRGSHLCEAFVRAIHCLKDKGLSLFLA